MLLSGKNSGQKETASFPEDNLAGCVRRAASLRIWRGQRDAAASGSLILSLETKVSCGLQ